MRTIRSGHANSQTALGTVAARIIIAKKPSDVNYFMRLFRSGFPNVFQGTDDRGINGLKEIFHVGHLTTADPLSVTEEFDEVCRTVVGFSDRMRGKPRQGGLCHVTGN
jgi:hypothetical protein